MIKCFVMLFCSSLLAVLASVDSSEVPACSANRGSDLEADDDGALSLMQRHAYRTSNQDTGTSKTRPIGSEADIPHEHPSREERIVWKAPRIALPQSSAAVEISSNAQTATVTTTRLAAGQGGREGGVIWRKQRNVISSVKLAAKSVVSMPHHQSSLLDRIGPVPLSLLAMDTHVHGEKAATLSGFSFVLLITIALAAVCLIIFMYFLVSERKVMIQNQRLQNEKVVAKGLWRNGSSKNAEGERTSLNGGRIETQSSISSTNSLNQGHYSPLAPQLIIPGTQQPHEAAVLHFPLKAASKNERGSHSIYWHDMASPWFRLDIEAGLGSQKEQLSLYEVHSGSSALCAKVTLSQPDLADGAQSYYVDNSKLLAPTNGLNMRTRKSMEDTSRDAIRVIAWGQMVTGIDNGDDWLEVKEGGTTYYLPMVVNGKRVVIAGNSVAGSQDIDVLTVSGELFATFRWNCKDGRTYRYAVVRNEVKIADVQIPGPSGLLLEVTAGSRRIAHVDAISMGGGKDPDMLEMFVECMDPVVLLLGAVGMLRRLPPHSGRP